ncbi:MerR family transcriptional regulator [Streptomyces lavenduligriseus]|uniref:MerR family transcriptional regulator n=2 Tax=Streptomyces lavenduligriseus TaxID=67315 RepID=A0ABT0NXK5_9ACTN|nr:MerR family transcriptional regulator [Streptomyces lavenduligriseus]
MIKAVRYYESLGLITPHRLANGYRDYDEDDVRAVREIRALSSLGIAVEHARPFLACLAAGQQHADGWPASLAGYREAIDELTEWIEMLTSRRATLISYLRQAAHRNSSTTPPDHGEHAMSWALLVKRRGRPSTVMRRSVPHLDPHPHPGGPYGRHLAAAVDDAPVVAASVHSRRRRRPVRLPEPADRGALLVPAGAHAGAQ